jgi:type VI secretion system Hcp family effector
MKKPYSLIKRAAWLLLPLCMSVAYTTQADNDMFLEFPSSSTIQGESQHSVYRDHIEVLKFSEGMTSTFADDYQSGGGKTNRNALAVTKYLDRSSPALRKALVEGRVLYDAILRVVRPSGNPDGGDVYFVIKLEQVRVTKVSMSASGGEDRLTEEVELTFAKITWTYTPWDANGKPGNAEKAGWDFQKNQSYDR